MGDHGFPDFPPSVEKSSIPPPKLCPSLGPTKRNLDPRDISRRLNLLGQMLSEFQWPSIFKQDHAGWRMVPVASTLVCLWRPVVWCPFLRWRLCPVSRVLVASPWTWNCMDDHGNFARFVHFDRIDRNWQLCKYSFNLIDFVNFHEHHWSKLTTNPSILTIPINFCSFDRKLQTEQNNLGHP